MALQVGILGEFQSGKSTLINCLLENRIALSGNGISTTKQIVKYFYSDKISIRNINKTNSPIKRLKDFSRLKISDKDFYYEIGLPSPILKEIELWDTPGLNADERDDEVAAYCLDELDYVIILIGGHRGALTTSEKKLIGMVSNKNIPYIVVFNFQESSNIAWDTYSKRNDSLRKNLLAEMKILGSTKTFILPINTAWFWYSFIEKTTKKLFLPASDGENYLMKSVSTFVYCNEFSKDEIERKSNILELKNYLTTDGVCFDNVHFIAPIYKLLSSIQKSFLLKTKE